ncbi:MAG: hypothetical protein QOC62_1385 [Mycobacterium sp.]|nr:hypothetical protein [Mycobacterium sp.]
MTCDSPAVPQLDGKREGAWNLPGAEAYAASCAEIPGWFAPQDFTVFDAILAHQLEVDIKGELLEIGCYYGRSAIMMGYGLRENETLIACDMFENVMGQEDIPIEIRERWLSDVHVDHFYSNWDRYHTRRPDVRMCDSALLDLDRDVLRFSHIDGSHSYQYVEKDIALVASHTGSSGVIAMDDYRFVRYPGVARAAWGAVERDVLHPFCATEEKLYATVTPDDQRYWADVMKDLPGAEVYEMPDYDMVVMPCP